MLSALQLHWFWTEHFYICHIPCPAYAHLENLIRVSLNENPDFMWICSYLSPLNSVLSHKTLCVYMFYWQSHLDFQHYCASHQRCIWGWKELREINTNDCLRGLTELYHSFDSSKRWGGNHRHYLLLFPDSANGDLCRNAKQKNGLIRIKKTVQWALKQDSGYD